MLAELRLCPSFLAGALGLGQSQVVADPIKSSVSSWLSDCSSESFPPPSVQDTKIKVEARN